VVHATSLKSLSIILDQRLTFNEHATAVVKSCNYHARVIRHVRHLLTESVAQTLSCSLINSRLDSTTATRCCTVFQRPLLTSYKEHKTLQLVQSWVPTVEPTPDHYFDNSTGFQYANASSARQRCWCVEWTWLLSRPTWRNTSFNASHLVSPAQLHHRYCLSRDWPLISQDIHSPMPHLSFGTVCLQKSCCAI